MMKKTEKPPAAHMTVIAAALAALLLALAACGGNNATAATMHLRRTEGTVSVSDGDGTDVPLLENLGLYSGYGVGTSPASYAWIDLDDVKLTKLDQNSEISIQKKGKSLDIEVKSGSLFFNVTEPLADDETMSIRASTMLVGIRGTSGWVEAQSGVSRVYILEGKVECSAGDQTVQVNAWEMAELRLDGELTVQEFDEGDLPAFVREELESGDVDEPHGWDGQEGQEPAYRYPVQELSAEHKAYLDEVWAAMEASDLDALNVLAQNDMVREIVVDVVAPYVHRLLEEYEELENWHITEGEYATSSETDYNLQYSHIYYNGEVFTIESGYTDHLKIYYYYNYDQEQGGNTHVTFVLCSYSSANGTAVLSHEKAYFDSYRDYSAAESITWKDRPLQIVNSAIVPTGEWTFYEKFVYDRGDGPWWGEMQTRGEFLNILDEGINDGMYLENGQVTLRCTDESGLSASGTIDVADGYVVRKDDVCLLEYNEYNEQWQFNLDSTSRSFWQNHRIHLTGKGWPQTNSPYHLIYMDSAWGMNLE